MAPHTHNIVIPPRVHVRYLGSRVEHSLFSHITPRFLLRRPMPDRLVSHGRDSGLPRLPDSHRPIAMGTLAAPDASSCSQGRAKAGSDPYYQVHHWLTQSQRAGGCSRVRYGAWKVSHYAGCSNGPIQCPPTSPCSASCHCVPSQPYTQLVGRGGEVAATFQLPVR